MSTRPATSSTVAFRCSQADCRPQWMSPAVAMRTERRAAPGSGAPLEINSMNIALPGYPRSDAMRRLIVLCTTVAALAAAAPADAVIGGRPATEAYPWQIALADGQGQFCGASLVRPGWALTAAHCVEGEKAENLRVILGRHKLSSSD